MNRFGAETHRKHGERGASLIEFALTFPVFMMIVMGIIYFCLLLKHRNGLERAVRTAGRDAEVHPYKDCKGPEGIDAHVAKAISNYYGDRPDELSVNLVLEPGTDIVLLQITVRHAFPLFTVPFAPQLTNVAYNGTFHFPLARDNQLLCDCEDYPSICPPP